MNRLTTLPRAPILCAGPGAAAAMTQAERVEALGGHPVIVDGHLAPPPLATCRK